ncbi:cytochrome aa3 quinol oxidase subunit II [Peribacillus sp. B-H-3]|uniref:cytochrome aa3 quinol oxidase subunit II n=1 Tax=Peribacillus sp. B-H-3 TaxID=3400420 RepID=UPI003B02050E
MKMKWAFLFIIFTIATVLSGCENSLLIFDPKGPVAKTQSDTILFSILVMIFILLVVYVLFVIMLTKYRASKADKDYEPPHDEGSKVLETIWIAIPVIIVAVLSVVTVRTTNAVETTPKGYESQKPVVIYAASSNWKWHFSYPEENIETVNYVNIPTNRPIEFRLYSYGPISSFWIPQLAGQKYAMSDMVNKLRLVANAPGSFMGRNSNFSGRGFADMDFEAQSLSPKDYKKWVADVKNTAPKLTESKFNKLLKAEHVGRETFTSTHLKFNPAPEGKNASHHHGGDADMKSSDMDGMDMGNDK